MIVEYLKAYVENNNALTQCGFCWNFTNARKDYANLESLTDTTKCCVQFILEDYTVFTETDPDGDIKQWRCSFTVFVGLNSKFDVQYDNELKHELRSEGKYKMYIEKIEKCIKDHFHNDICSTPLVRMGNHNYKPDINKYDSNLDGVYLKGDIIFKNEDNL